MYTTKSYLGFESRSLRNGKRLHSRGMRPFYASSASWLAGCCIKRPVYARGISAVLNPVARAPRRAVRECGAIASTIPPHSSASWLAGCCIKRPVYARGISAVVSRCKGLPARATGMRSASEHTLLEYYAAPFGFAPICGGFRLRKGAS